MLLVFDWWLDVIWLKSRYILHWFQYRNSYFEHPSVSENGTRSAKMACCFFCKVKKSWCRHQMETVTGEFPSQRPVTRSYDVSFDLRINKRLSELSWGCWFGTPLRSLWRHCNVIGNVFSFDQAALWMVQSVRPSVRLSVCLSVTPFWLCSHHPIIMKFSGVITSDKSDVHAKGQGQRSKVKVTEVTTQLNSFRTVTPVWIHIWWWDDAYSLIMLRRGALLFFKVIRQISRSHGSKIRRIWPKLAVSGL